MGSALYTGQVMAALAERLGATLPAATATPFGVSLEPAWGLYAAGQRVSAPGLDDCSPRLDCEVAAVGRRADRDGVWYLLRCIDRHGGHALVHEDDLKPMAADARPARGAVPGAATRLLPPAKAGMSSAVIRHAVARHAGAAR